MADDTSVGSKRRITEIEEVFLLHHHQQQQHQEHSCSSFSTVSSQGDSVLSPTKVVQEEANHQDNPSPTSFKKVKSSCLTEPDASLWEKQEVGFEENEVKLDFLNEKNVACCELVSGSSESGESNEMIESCGVKVNETEISVDGGLKKGEIDDAKEVKEKGKDFVGSECFEAEMGLGTDDNKEFVKVKESGGEILLEAKKKQLLEELEVGSIFKNKTSADNNVDDFDTNAGVSGSLKGFDEAVSRSLKIELIDDTVLIGPVSVTKTGNGGANVAEKNGKKNGKQETDVKKERRTRRRGKVATKGLEKSEGQEKVTQVGEAQNRTIHVGGIRDGCATDGDQTKRKYSRVEMEVLRYAYIVEQRKLWRDVYTGLGDDVVEGYKDLASSKHRKNVCLNFNPREPFGRKGPGILGEESSENVDDGLENMDGDGVQIVDLLNPACISSIEGEGAATLLVEEYGEEDDSDDDYASIQRPAFTVEGEPDFDSGPPEDGLEYLRRVRWEAARIPKVKVAELDRSRVKKEQTVYMPQIPDIAKCPDYLLPSRQWEDAFLADFSELRMFLSQNDGPSAKISHKKQPAAIVHGSCSPQLAENIIVEKFNNLRTDEVQSFKQPDTSSSESITDQQCMESREDCRSSTSFLHPTPETSSSDALCNYPTLPVILAMDSVARVSMLRRHIKLAESTDALSKNDSVWLFALCAAVDTPLDADTCAALRGLLRKCASLRAGKSELDDEVWLYDWWLAKAEGDDLAVSGFTFREGLGTRLFCPAAILKRHYATILETKDGITVTISGFINRDRTRENGFSFQICERFQLGFPHSWLELATQLGGEESANKGVPPGKSGFDEPKMSSGTSTSAASVSFDDIPVTRIRDVLTHPLGESSDCALADMLEQFCSNNVELPTKSTIPDSENPVAVANAVGDETPRKNKRKAGQKYKDGGIIPPRVDEVMGEHNTPSRGIVTRSMSKWRSFRENPSSNSVNTRKAFRNHPEKVPSPFIGNKDDPFLSTSEATKNLPGGVTSRTPRKDSRATASTVEKILDVSDVSLVRRSSSRLNIRKDYRDMQY
ncbi:hypothetical protein SADUNF_Sadunf07G0106800 [Salix dunnii]|uniref:SANTA domain-containing protein n=1 Tax=Salix dunnii TaxID=1413687 RepID=A0A835N2G9_9ROSI|nr:hypothetical protein SADUNF_Sadunf07G0106800 [Salix dunnii]